MSINIVGTTTVQNGGGMVNKIRNRLVDGVFKLVVIAGLNLGYAASIYAGDNINLLKDISFSSLPGGRFEVQLKFSEPPQLPVGYEIEKPARIVFDFSGVKSELASKKFPLPFENAQSAVVLGGEDRTRLILNMTTLDAYTTRVDGNNIFVEVGKNTVRDVLTKSNTLADVQSSDISVFDSAVTSVDFRRGESGEGKVLIDMSKPANVNVEQTSKEIKLTFLSTKLPVDLRRKLDVVDFATPVTSVSSSFDGKDTIVSIQPTGEYDYLAYQVDNVYVVSVKRLTAAERDEKKNFAFLGGKVVIKLSGHPGSFGAADYCRFYRVEFGRQRYRERYYYPEVG